MTLHNIYLLILLAPLLGVVSGGFLGKYLPNSWVHRAAIMGVGISFLLSVYALWQHILLSLPPQQVHLYQWLMLMDRLTLNIGFLVDYLTLIMVIIVTSISLLVHIYTIGYMKGDQGYKRFFAYISLFTFAMLVLVMSNNFLQLFFGWEAVGLVSYLLIGFWFKKPSALYANLKAFLINRVGDLGMLLGIVLIFYHFGSLDYHVVFAQITPDFLSNHLFELIALLLFIGAMGKSAQIPLHSWLPDSMEGPTPISALIHAATMVTAGIFMVSRLSPLFEQAPNVLVFILIIGSLTAFLMGLVGLVQNDIKRVIAYSTLSQLGYMVAALGVSAYSAAIFHLITHAFFKALLFLGAGGVIVAMHHAQDIRQFGGLGKKLPLITVCMLLASISLAGVPGFSGFFSKDLILYAVKNSNLALANVAYYLLLISVLVTTLYSARLIFLTFFGKPKNTKALSHFHPPSWHIQLPLVLLLVPSVLIGFLLFEPLILNDQYLSQAIFTRVDHQFLSALKADYPDAASFIMHGLFSAPMILILIGILIALVLYGFKKHWPARLVAYFPWFNQMLRSGYGFDRLNTLVFIKGTQTLSKLTHWFDQNVIDRGLVMSWAVMSKRLGGVLSKIQSGYMSDYILIVLAACFLLMIGVLLQ